MIVGEQSDQLAYRFYGRRKGHALRPGCAALIERVLPDMRVTPDDLSCSLSRCFPAARREFWLEIGFGGGEHLLWQARQNPDVGLIGVEPFINGVAKILKGIVTHQVENIRLYDGDVRDFLPVLATGSLARIFILFPDPWCKARHRKRRIVSGELVDIMARLLKPGGELRIASDIPDYVDWIMRRILNHPDFQWQARCARDWRVRPSDWPVTRYEAKALREGRCCSYLRFLRRDSGSSVSE